MYMKKKLKRLINLKSKAQNYWIINLSNITTVMYMINP